MIEPDAEFFDDSNMAEQVRAKRVEAKSDKWSEKLCGMMSGELCEIECVMTWAKMGHIILINSKQFSKLTDQERIKKLSQFLNIVSFNE